MSKVNSKYLGQINIAKDVSTIFPFSRHQCPFSSKIIEEMPVTLPQRLILIINAYNKPMIMIPMIRLRYFFIMIITYKSFYDMQTTAS